LALPVYPSCMHLPGAGVPTQGTSRLAGGTHSASRMWSYSEEHTREIQPVVARTANGGICTNTHSPTAKRGHTAPPREATPRGARAVAFGFGRVVVSLGGDPKCTARRSQWKKTQKEQKHSVEIAIGDSVNGHSVAGQRPVGQRRRGQRLSVVTTAALSHASCYVAGVYLGSKQSSERGGVGVAGGATPSFPLWGISTCGARRCGLSSLSPAIGAVVRLKNGIADQR
jgi:hypothetical protein